MTAFITAIELNGFPLSAPDVKKIWGWDFPHQMMSMPQIVLATALLRNSFLPSGLGFSNENCYPGGSRHSGVFVM